MSTLGGVSNVVNCTTAHEQTQSNRVCNFHFLFDLLALEGSHLFQILFPTITFKLMHKNPLWKRHCGSAYNKNDFEFLKNSMTTHENTGMSVQ